MNVYAFPDQIEDIFYEDKKKKVEILRH